MFGSAKPLASLSSSLLARKGQARPAMRPQGYGFGPVPGAGDDLGWNDMGLPPSLPEPAPVLPPVLAEREALRQEIEAPAPVAEPAPEPTIAPAAIAEPAPPALVAAVGLETRRAGKAAFTLRLPADRHLRLRLASALCHRSAQLLVTEALDAFLATLPEVEELARQCPADRLGNGS